MMTHTRPSPVLALTLPVVLGLAIAARAACPPSCAIPGGGTAALDCQAEFSGAGLRLNYKPLDPLHPKPGKEVRCFDGDATCDTDGVADNACVFDVDVCLRNADPNLPLCTPADVSAVTVKGTATDPDLAALQGALSGLQSALAGLSDVQSLAQRAVTTSSDIVQASATNAAAVGSYNLSNIHLANAESLISSGSSSSSGSLGSGSIAIQVGGGSTVTINIASGSSSLSGIASAIDQSGVGVTASIRASLARMDLAPEARLAIAFAWHGDPDYARIAAAGRAIAAAVAPDGRRGEPLLLMIDGDVGRTFGKFLRDELGLEGDLVSIDGVQLHELDFVDVGALISPPGVVPVVIKSLLFS